MAKKGQKSQAGLPEIWEAVKSVRITARITPLAKDLLASRLRSLSKRFSWASFSELVEQLARGKVKIISAKSSPIADLIVKEIRDRVWSVKIFQKESHIPLERIDALLDSEPATLSELIFLQRLLRQTDGSLYDSEKLRSLNNGKISDIGTDERDSCPSSSNADEVGIERDRIS